MYLRANDCRRKHSSISEPLVPRPREGLPAAQHTSQGRSQPQEMWPHSEGAPLNRASHLVPVVTGSRLSWAGRSLQRC